MLIRYGKADGKMSKEAKNTYEDIINSYSYGANISVSDIKKKVLKK